MAGTTVYRVHAIYITTFYAQAFITETFRHQDIYAPRGSIAANFCFRFFTSSQQTLQTEIKVTAFIAKNACCKYVQIIIDQKCN